MASLWRSDSIRAGCSFNLAAPVFLLSLPFATLSKLVTRCMLYACSCLCNQAETETCPCFALHPPASRPFMQTFREVAHAMLMGRGLATGGAHGRECTGPFSGSCSFCKCIAQGLTDPKQTVLEMFCQSMKTRTHSLGHFTFWILHFSMESVRLELASSPTAEFSRRTAQPRQAEAHRLLMTAPHRVSSSAMA